MKKSILEILIIGVILFTCLSVTKAQVFNESSKEVYTTTITLLGNPPQIRGFLKEVQGDSVNIISELREGAPFQKVAIHDIHEIQFKPEDPKVVGGMFMGAISGLAVGAGIGFFGGNGSFYGTYAMLPGSLIGLLSSFAKVKIPINGRTNFEKERLIKYRVVF